MAFSPINHNNETEKLFDLNHTNVLTNVLDFSRIYIRYTNKSQTKTSSFYTLLDKTQENTPLSGFCWC